MRPVNSLRPLVFFSLPIACILAFGLASPLQAEHIPGCTNTEIDSDNHDDVFEGGSSCDVYFGKNGWDVAYGRFGKDDLHMGAGLDEAHGDRGDDWLYGGDSPQSAYEYLFGAEGADRLEDRGDFHYDNDFLCGGRENDFLAADDGDYRDYLWGGGGEFDTLVGDPPTDGNEQPDGQC